MARTSGFDRGSTSHALVEPRLASVFQTASYALVGKMQVARLCGLPDDDPDADEIALFLAETDRMCAAATWPARDDTVAARVRKRRRS